MPFTNEGSGALEAGEAIKGQAELLLFNYLRGSVLTSFAAENGTPNPSSQAPHAPYTNLWTPNRRETFKTNGNFTISNSSYAPPNGWEMAPNENMRVTDGGGTANVEMRKSGPTEPSHFSTPEELAAHITDELNADATLARTDYLVSYSRVTHKWTIEAGGNFTLTGDPTDASSILPTLGFILGPYSGASSYTGEERAIHTEEWVTLTLSGTDYATWNGYGWPSGGESTLNWRWVALLNTNFQLRYVESQGGNKVSLMADGALATIEDSAPEQVGKIGINHGVDEWSAGYGRMTGLSIGAGLGPGFTPLHLMDYQARYNNTSLEPNGPGPVGPDHAYVKLKMVDRTNPAGHLEVGYLYVGPGWRPVFNHRAPFEFGIEDATAVSVADGGDQHSSYGGAPKVARLDFQDLDRDDRAFLEGWVHGPRRSHSTVTGRTAPDLRLVGGKHHPSILVQRDMATDYDAGAKGEIAAQAIFGRVEYEVLRGSARAPRRYDLSLRVREEPA